MGIENKVVFVTGGSLGIGRDIAKLLLEKNVKLSFCGRRREVLNEAMEYIGGEKGDVLALAADVRDEYQVNMMIRKTVDRFGRLDVLINNAGFAVKRAFIDTSQEDWDNTIDTNLKGTFLCSKAALPILRANNGMIINVASILGTVGASEMAAYCASKFGIIGLGESLAKETSSMGVTIVTVCPNATYTDLHKKIAGEETAKVGSMTSQEVALQIVKIVSGEVSVKSGENVYIPKRSLSSYIRGAVIRSVRMFG